MADIYSPMNSLYNRGKRIQLLRRRLRLTGIVAFLLLAVALAVYGYKFGPYLSARHEDWGTFGDYFGGLLNPALSLLGLLALLYTIALQLEELELSRKELQASTRAIQDQASTASIQLEESTFFQMIKLHNSIVQDVSNGSAQGRNALIAYSIDLFNMLAEPIKDAGFDHHNHTLRVTYERFYTHHGQRLGHYFRNMYLIARFVDRSSMKDKQSKMDILRAQLSQPEQMLLYHNVAVGPGENRFKPLVEKYGLLDHVDMKILGVRNPERFIAPSAFGESNAAL